MRRTTLLLLLLLPFFQVAEAQRSTSRLILNVDEQNYYLHSVAEGESVADVAALYDLAESEVVAENGLDPVAPAISAGEWLRVPCYERTSRLQPKRGDKRYERYRAMSGESLFRIAVNFAIPLDTLLEDNPGVDITNLRKHSAIYVRHSAKGKAQLAEIQTSSRRMAGVLNGLSRQHNYFTVEEGMTLYSLAAQYGVGVNELADENGNPDLIYVGMTLKCRRPVEDVAIEGGQIDGVTDESLEEVVAQLDSLSQREVQFRPFDKEVMTISLMLPLSDTLGRVRGGFVEFYQGALLAAEDLKAEGRSVDLQLFNTLNSADNVARLVAEEPSIANTDLFIGPIYERNAAAVIEYAAQQGVPVVSPLESTTEGSYGRHYYRMAPTDSTHQRKLHSLVGPETNVIMVYTASNDENMEREILSVLGDHPYGKVIYNEKFEVDSLASRPIEELMATEDNLFVVLSDNELDSDRSLAIISSMMNSRQPKYGTRRVPIRVIGSADWAKYRNMDRNLLFKLDVSYVANYHADRGNELVKDFDRRYIRSFGRAPSMFAYRAYDAVKLFASALFAGGDLTAELNGSVVPLLQTPYSFTEEGGNMVNDSWPLVNYRPNYTIEVR